MGIMRVLRSELMDSGRSVLPLIRWNHPRDLLFRSSGLAASWLRRCITCMSPSPSSSLPLLLPLIRVNGRLTYVRDRRLMKQEKTSTYRWYSLLNMLAVLSSFAAAAGLIISSATKHVPAVGKCRVSHASSLFSLAFPSKPFNSLDP
jgi:hypothetical protein